MIEAIEIAVDREDWPRARRLIQRELKRKPENHWLLNRLGLTYYEQLDFTRAVKYIEKALKIAPHCPLALWDLAHCKDMQNKWGEAVALYRKIIKRGVERIAHGDCGQGKAWARGLVADCHFRMAICYHDMRKKKLAVKAMKDHLGLRGPGCRSNYEIEHVRGRLQRLEE